MKTNIEIFAADSVANSDATSGKKSWFSRLFGLSSRVGFQERQVLQRITNNGCLNTGFRGSVRYSQSSGDLTVEYRHKQRLIMRGTVKGNLTVKGNIDASSISAGGDLSISM